MTVVTPNQTRLVRESFKKIEPRASIVALLFYQRLFASHPSIRHLFHHDIESQGEKLMQLLTFAVASLEDPRALQPALESLGRRHVHYGVEEYQYDLVGTALLSTLENILGTSFSPELREAWQAVYTQMADVMKEAARHTPTSTGRNDVHPTIEGSTPETGKHPPLPGHEIPQPWNRLKKRFPGKSE